MEAVISIQSDASRHRRHHSRHHSNLSLGGMSFQSLNIDESEEPHDHGHNRKQSLPEIPHSLAWVDGADDEEDEEQVEDDRDARERLLSEGDVRRERLMTDDEVHCRLLPSIEVDTKSDFRNSTFCIGIDNLLQIKNDHIEKDWKSESHEDPRQRTCFRRLTVSCPEMPDLDDSLLPVGHSERVDLVLRRARAFTEDENEIYGATSTERSVRSIAARRYERSDSMLIDAKYGSLNSVVESPTSVWVYWEENLESAASTLPFFQSFQP